jgi:hypothetical protein
MEIGREKPFLSLPFIKNGRNVHAAYCPSLEQEMIVRYGKGRNYLLMFAEWDDFRTSNL